jgi:predicted glycosyltransferase involved in capsule biosynthesis
VVQFRRISLREKTSLLMKVSIIIPWCDRPELARSLPGNAAWFAETQAEVIIVSSACVGNQLRQLVNPCSYRGIRLLHIEGVEHFNKPECLNVGAFFSRTDWVLTLDADIILNPDFLDASSQAIAERNRFTTVKEVVELGPEIRTQPSDPHGAILRRIITTEVVHENGNRASIEYGVDKHGTRSGVGLVLVKKEDFVGVQGLNSNLRGWGYEDFDFQIRLQLGRGLERISLGHAQHVSHASALSANLSHSRNISLAWQNYAQGKLHGTYQSDVDRLKKNVVESTL